MTLDELRQQLDLSILKWFHNADKLLGQPFPQREEVYPLAFASFRAGGELAGIRPMATDDRAESIAALDLPLHPSNHVVRELIVAAKLYCIARDEGMEAAMLWKLAN